MANTSLAEQLKRLAAPQTNILFHRKTRPSLLFDPSEAAEIDRATFYEIGISGLNELKKINGVFEEFRKSLFDETSKTFERAVETYDVNHRLNVILKKFLYLASPYFLLKPTQKALEWLIVRFHIHDYNTNDLICSALPYHGTRLFARLIQVFDLKKSNPQWQWLYPLQKKGIPLSKITLFNHCASDVNFLKLICDMTVDAVKIFESNASKLTTLFAFFSTTMIGTIQNMTTITEDHLTHMLPSILFGLSSDCVDYCASSFMIISSILVKSSFQDRLRKKLTEKITKIEHKTLQNSVIILLNILYQAENLKKVSLSPTTIKHLAASAEWFIPTMNQFLASGVHPNVFYLLIIRDGLNSLNDSAGNDHSVFSFIHNLINSCRVDDECAEKMIKIVIDEARKNCDENCCELVKNLENQYPNAWDSAISALFKEEPNESLSRVLGFTSATMQVEIFQKLNHPIAAIRTEAIKNIANNSDSFKVAYIENSLRARWNDEDPKVIEAMFSLPENLRFYSAETFEKLLLKIWLESNDEWNSLLLKVLQSLKTNDDFQCNPTKYLILLLPFLITSSKEVQMSILRTDLPLFSTIRKNIKRNPGNAIVKVLKGCSDLPGIDDLTMVYETLTPENVHIFTVVLLLSLMYESCNSEDKFKILTFFFEEIFSTHFEKVKWKPDTQWIDNLVREYYSQTTSKIPSEIAFKFLESIILHTTSVEKFSCSGWCDFADEHSNLIAVLYRYLNLYPKLNNDIGYKIFLSPFVEKISNAPTNQLAFLCNMCVLYQHEPQIQLQSLKMMHQLLDASNECHEWALNAKSKNVLVPCLLIAMYSSDSTLRSQAMPIVGRLARAVGPTLTKHVTYADFLRHLYQFADEIMLDREQLPARLYALLAQDDDVQALLPVTLRSVTRIFHDALLDCVADERTPLLVAASVLRTFEYLRDASVMRKLAPLASRVVRGSDFPNEAGSQIVRHFVDKFSVAVVQQLLDDDTVFAFVDHCVQQCGAIKIREKSGVLSVGTLLLRKFAVDLFDALNATSQKYFLDFVLRVCSCGAEMGDVVPAANSFVKKVTLDCKLLAPYLAAMKAVALDSAKKKSTSTRASTDDEPSVLGKPEWKMGIALLELIQNKKKLSNCQLIVPALFDVLRKCCEMDDHLPTEYAKQVCLSCILNCTQKMAAQARSTKQLESLFNVELIVSCIRMSPNPQTHHHALLLLAHGASFAPTQVLRNIMAIFTFMGSSVLRQDDAFSLQIISNILETLVPLLVRGESSPQDGDAYPSVSAIVSVLRVFAVSIPDLPDHRRVPLLVKLMKILRNGEFVHLLVILSMASCAKATTRTTAPHSKTAAAKYVAALQELLLQLPPHISLSTFDKVIRYVNELPHNLDEKTFDCHHRNDELFDLKTHTNKELCHFKYLLLSFVATAISEFKFMQQISAVDEDELQSLKPHFKGIIEQIILYLKGILDFTSSSKFASAKYWKVMISQALEILNKSNALLPSDMFITVIQTLVEHNCLLVQRKSLELLNWRLQAAKDGTTKDDFSTKTLMSLVPHVMKIVATISDDNEDGANAYEMKLNQQIALISVKLLVKHCSASGNMQPFKPILSQLISLHRKQMNEHVLACLILCVAELMFTLKIQAIDALPKFIPALISLFEPYQHESIVPNDVILISIITALQKIVESLPNFLSPYLESILFEITRITALLNKNNDTENKVEEKTSTLAHKLKLIRQKIAAEVPSRVLLPSVSACFAHSCETENLNSIRPLLDILIDSFPKNSQISPELTSLFLSLFDFRCTTKSASNEEISLIEQYCSEALCNIVLKCSETTFRPFYHKLYDWGVIASKESAKSERILTYYSILCSLSESLKSIFVLFAGNFIRNAVELLGKNNISKIKENNHKSFVGQPEKCVLLVDSILKTLHNVFKYDTVKFLTKDRFNMLMEPLVNQIENTIGDYERRSTEIIIPCVAKFAAATSDDSLWKQFNYLILLKTRHSLPEVRLAALETVCTFATYLGDNFLPFLPETVPFIAELLEDENEMVEKQTHKAVQRLEQILEEPIQKYF